MLFAGIAPAFPRVFLVVGLQTETPKLFFSGQISLNGRYEASLLFEKTFISCQYASLESVFIFPIT